MAYMYEFLNATNANQTNFDAIPVIVLVIPPGSRIWTEYWDRVSTILQGPRIGIESILKKDRK